MSKKAPSSKRSSPPSPTPLLFADTQKSADQRYVAGFSVPDAFISFKRGRKWYALLNQLELARGLKESRFDEVLPLEDFMDKARDLFGMRRVGYTEVIAAVAAEFGFDAVRVPADFPSGIAFKLLDFGLAIDVAEGSLFPGREAKSEEEIERIRDGNRCSAAGIRAAEKALRASKEKNGKLYLEGKALTSERLREIIEIACLRMGAISAETIAAGGDEACDPHSAGSGPLRANELIIVDVFPKVTKTGYFGDMTRTFLKGRASDKQKALVEAVRQAQKEAISRVKAGVNGKSIHDGVVTCFAKLGFENRRTATGAEGFIHGTGHGLGLEIHESPRVSSVSQKFKKNTVVTIEPGLYYPGLGGCRIEDVVVAREDGPEMISSYHYRWQIK